MEWSEIFIWIIIIGTILLIIALADALIKFLLSFPAKNILKQKELELKEREIQLKEEELKYNQFKKK